jgi:hypothetical protein
MEAEATIAAIIALQKRAKENASSVKSGYAAAAEETQEAVVLAQCLPGLSEDNLVALSLQVERCGFLRRQASRTYRFSDGETDAFSDHLLHESLAAASSLLLLATAALFRRMDAGTLQPGRCAPLEEAWSVAHATSLEIHGRTLVDESRLLRFGQLVGLAVLYDAAIEATAILEMSLVEYYGSTQQMLLVVEYYGSTQQMLLLIVRALESMSEPRPVEEVLLRPELTFALLMPGFQKNKNFSKLIASQPEYSNQLQRFFDTWARVQATGVLKRRGIRFAILHGAHVTRAVEESSRVEAAVVARQARRGLRSCGLASCGAKEAHVSHFKGCGACKTVFYCRREHQVEDWPAHKAACKAARKAAAAGQ